MKNIYYGHKQNRQNINKIITKLYGSSKLLNLGLHFFKLAASMTSRWQPYLPPKDALGNSVDKSLVPELLIVA